jgi:hypothetical protein
MVFNLRTDPFEWVGFVEELIGVTGFGQAVSSSLPSQLVAKLTAPGS